MSEKCPCCSGEQYSLCCQPFLNGQQTPQRAEQLMRSRYSAYVKQNAAWLVETWHPSQRVAGLETLLSESFATTEWLGLNVTRCNHGSHENEAFVTFLRVISKKAVPAACMNVHAFFARINAGTMSTEQRRS